MLDIGGWESEFVVWVNYCGWTRYLREIAVEEDVDDDSYRYHSCYFDNSDRLSEAALAGHIADNNGEFERFGITTAVTRRDRDDELEVGDQGKGGAFLMGIGGQDFLETPD